MSSSARSQQHQHFTAQSLTQGCQVDPVTQRIVTAAVVKFGGEGRTRQEALTQFCVELGKAIGEPVEIEFRTKLESLRKSVGDDTFNKMLANPRIEALAESAWREEQEKVEGDKLGSFFSQFNGALTPQDIEHFMTCFEGELGELL